MIWFRCQQGGTGSKPVHFKLIFEKPTGRILGSQAIGKGDPIKKVDIIAAMITMGADLEVLKELELCYAPSFSTAKDIVNIQGSFLQLSYYEYFNDMTSDRERILTGYNFE